jgi:hypothetical protein
MSSDERGPGAVGTARLKIFGIGLSKTGTSSLAQALQRLGFRTKDCMGARRYIAGDLSSLDMDTVLAHDALTDTPIPSFYRELDARFPGSKFILTVREREGWLASCRKQFNERSAATQSDAHRRIFEDLYGTNVFDAQRFAAGYERFVAGVMDYFGERPADLLVLDVTAGEGWEKLCPFLDRPLPDLPFPKANVTQIRWMNIDDLVAVAEAAGRELLKRYTGRLEPGARASAGMRSRTAMGLLDRAVQAALGHDAAEAARRAAHRAIVAGLRKLNAGIPVLSPLDDAPAYSERRHWNHFWLVDPLDGRNAFVRGASAFSVNIALVEDGCPICGVVHAPAGATTYFARVGKGAFRRDGGDNVPLDRTVGTAKARSAVALEGDSVALAVCAGFESAPGSTSLPDEVREWQLAAADAVLRSARFGDDTADGDRFPAYNTPGLSTSTRSLLDMDKATAAATKDVARAD